MNDIDWKVRKNVRELVKKHTEITREAALNGTLEQTQLDVGDEVSLISDTLDEETAVIFLDLYAEETIAVIAKTERETAELNMHTAELNIQTAEIELKAAEGNATAERVGQFIGAFVLFLVLFFIFKP